MEMEPLRGDTGTIINDVNGRQFARVIRLNPWRAASIAVSAMTTVAMIVGALVVHPFSSSFWGCNCCFLVVVIGDV